MYRHVILAAGLLIAAPAALEAQFTTLVPPPREPQPARAAQVEAEQRASADSIRREQLSDMRAWVDSAAVAIDAAPDTMVAIDSGDVMPVRPPLEPARPTPTREFREGAPAPETATSLPVLALVGIGALGVGAVLIGRPRA